MVSRSPQYFFVQKVAGADAGAGYFIGEGGPDALARGADGFAAERFLLQPLDEDMVGHNQVGAVADEQSGGIDAALVQVVHLAFRTAGLMTTPLPMMEVVLL